MVALNDSELRTIKKFASHPQGMGYVLSYSNSSFATLFDQKWSVDIDSSRFSTRGESKGNRLLDFCRLEPANIVSSVLEHLLQEAMNLEIQKSSIVTSADIERFRDLIARIWAIEEQEDDFGSNRELLGTELVERASQNTSSILLVSSAAIQSLSEFGELVAGDNQFAVEFPQERGQLLALLEAIISHLESLMGLLPTLKSGTDLQQGDALKTWTERYLVGALPKLQEYIAPEALGRTSVPIGIILTCGCVGSLLTGLSPIGFGAGSYVGKLITGEMKSGTAADHLKSQLSDD